MDEDEREDDQKNKVVVGVPDKLPVGTVSIQLLVHTLILMLTTLLRRATSHQSPLSTSQLTLTLTPIIMGPTSAQ